MTKLFIKKKIKTIVEVEEEATLNEYIGYKIKQLRNLKGINQEDFSKSIKLTRASLSNIESGRQALTLSRLSTICEVLGVKSSDIIPF